MIKPEQLEYITARLNKNENAERFKKSQARAQTWFLVAL